MEQRNTATLLTCTFLMSARLHVVWHRIHNINFPLQTQYYPENTNRRTISSCVQLKTQCSYIIVVDECYCGLKKKKQKISQARGGLESSSPLMTPLLFTLNLQTKLENSWTNHYPTCSSCSIAFQVRSFNMIVKQSAYLSSADFRNKPQTFKLKNCTYTVTHAAVSVTLLV